MRTAAFFLLAPALLAAADADLILHHGKIVTVDARFSIAEAVAVKAGKISAVGSSKAVLASERGPNTRLIDLQGRTVLPGLMDSHVHAYSAGLSEFKHPLPRIDSIEALQQHLRAQARLTPAGEWIVVLLPFPTRLKDMRMPTRRDLDVVTDHPVLLDHPFITVVNARGLQRSGIDRNTPNPEGGEIVKDDRGEPTGVLRNARGLLKGLPEGSRAQYSTEGLTENERLDALEKMLKLYVAAGITSIKDREATPEQEIPLYMKLREQGRLPLRVVLTWRLDTSRPTADLLREIDAAPYRPRAGDDWLKFDTFKVILDGGMLLGTAYQRHTYGDFARQLYAQTDMSDRGRPFVDPDTLYQLFRAAQAKGWQLAAHVQGGAAIDLLVDTFAKLDRVRPLAPTRSHVIHASFQGPESIASMARHGILADAQPAWLYCDSGALQRVFTYEGMKYFFPLRSYLDAGIKVAAGSDHMTGHDKNQATNPYNPFLGMWVAITRKNSQGQVIHPEQKVTREEALKMYTTWGAYMEFNEDKKGTIEPGKLADLVVIDRDYLTCPEDEIRNIQPVLTIVGGRASAGAGL
ncbi:MAG: amidohydrolase [Acidobacteriota bacterium]